MPTYDDRLAALQGAGRLGGDPAWRGCL
ncbi:hypothetical protein L615_006200000270, partial [Nocardioides sp. J9]